LAALLLTLGGEARDLEEALDLAAATLDLEEALDLAAAALDLEEALDLAAATLDLEEALDLAVDLPLDGKEENSSEGTSLSKLLSFDSLGDESAETCSKSVSGPLTCTDPAGNPRLKNLGFPSSSR